MSARLLSVVYVLGLLVPGMASAEQEAIEEEFLEFLGSWEGDEGWFELMEAAQANVLEESGEEVKSVTEAESND